MMLITKPTGSRDSSINFEGNVRNDVSPEKSSDFGDLV
jgi:hypothetical protein